jgi:hypothetical protein
MQVLRPLPARPKSLPVLLGWWRQLSSIPFAYLTYLIVGDKKFDISSTAQTLFYLTCFVFVFPNAIKVNFRG